jgi:transcriptional regulator with XRE-family HTH domain
MTTAGSLAPGELTPKHVRAARALLAWSQQELAKAAGVATSTVADFERGQRTPVANNALAMRRALESAGIDFLPTGAVIGPALPVVAASKHPSTPVRWVTAEDLKIWAGRTDGAFSLPKLLSFLIRATHGTAAQIRFPADEGVRQPDLDGTTFTETSSDYVPAGKACWEVTAQRGNIRQKAMLDYRKRTDTPGVADRANATFVFVTLGDFKKKDEWAKARRDEGHWREVRVHDVHDLVHWIEQCPAVGLWIARRLGVRPDGTRELDEIWEEWSRATRWPLTEELVLADRDQSAAEVLRWLRAAPYVLSLQATTTEEVVAFFHATLGELPDAQNQAYRARCVVATTSAAARALGNAPGPLILILTDPDPGLAQSLVRRGHHVLQAYDERLRTRGEVRELERPSREGIAIALVAAGIAEPRAKALARDSARNLAVLRRLISASPGRLPKWAEDVPPRPLLATLLAGGWDENSPADRAQLEELAGQPYDTITAALVSYVGKFDSPLQKVGSTWRIASPVDAWMLLAHNLTSADLTRFENAAQAVLGSADPRFDVDSGERWMAAVRGIHRDHSGMLRHGIGQVLILLALWGNEVRTVPDGVRRAEAFVGKLLSGADQRRWWSLSEDFRLLAEASPGAFLTAIEDSLDQDDPPIAVLFGQEDGGAFGAEHLSDLMWALEVLAWSPDLMPRVSHVLARLDAIDTKPRTFVNGPANSLREIHLLWMPQTHASLDERLRALDFIRKREPNAAWKLMLGILPGGHDVSSRSAEPKWRDYTVDKVERVTQGMVWRGAIAITERLAADVGQDPVRWSDLLDRLHDLLPGPESALDALEAAEPRVSDRSEQTAFWDKLRRVLHHHRQFPETDWSLPVDALHRLEAVYERFTPSDPLEQVTWLFRNSVVLPKPSAEGWEGERRDVDVARQQAAKALFDVGGKASALALARRVEVPGYLGKALHDSGLPAADLDALLKTAVRSDDAYERDLAHGLIVSMFRDRKKPWGEALVAKAKAEAWGDAALLTILRAFPVEPWTWDQVAGIGGDIEASYWQQTPVFWMNEGSEDTARALRTLIDVGRARDALPLAVPGAKVQLPTELLVELLDQAARQPFKSVGDPNEAIMFQYHVAEILQILDDRDDIDEKALAALEWKYLRVLEHSPRPAKVLHRALAEQPRLFVEILSTAFTASEESGIAEPIPEDAEQAHAVAEQADRLLDAWDRLPGTRDDGTIDGEALKAWITEARALAKMAGREVRGDRQIGKMLSASPMGVDGAWPAESVRGVIDLFRSKPMIDGFRSGKYNRRGMTSRFPRDGGELERREAAKYRAWAKRIAVEHPHTAKILHELADRYELEASRHDEDAERVDWEH